MIKLPKPNLNRTGTVMKALSERHSTCLLYTSEDAITTALKLPSLTKEDIETVPLNGHWRYYKLRGETWGTKFNNVW